MRQVRVLTFFRAVQRRFPLVVSLALLSVAVLAMQDTYRDGYDAGYGDGVESGQVDRMEHRPFDFANKATFQKADSGYDESLHERDVYSVAYRRGFEDGYEDGYGLEKEKSHTEAPRPGMVFSSGPVMLPEGTRLKVRLLQTLTTQRNERGDTFRAEVVQEVLSGSQVAIPRGTKVYGEITHLKRAGRIRGRAEMNLEFSEMEMPDGSHIPLSASIRSIEEQADEEVKDGGETIEGRGEKADDAKKIGASAGIGALIGVLTGGGRGAKIGGAVGAMAGLAGVLASRGADIVLPSETELELELNEDLSISTGLIRPRKGP